MLNAKIAMSDVFCRIWGKKNPLRAGENSLQRNISVLNQAAENCLSSRRARHPNLKLEFLPAHRRSTEGVSAANGGFTALFSAAQTQKNAPNGSAASAWL